MKRKIHPNSKIEEAIRYAENRGWFYKNAGESAHCWGKLLCPLSAREGCRMSIWSTPRHPENFAKMIKRRVEICSHSMEVL